MAFSKFHWELQEVVTNYRQGRGRGTWEGAWEHRQCGRPGQPLTATPRAGLWRMEETDAGDDGGRRNHRLLSSDLLFPGSWHWNDQVQDKYPCFGRISFSQVIEPQRFPTMTWGRRENKNFLFQIIYLQGSYREKGRHTPTHSEWEWKVDRGSSTCWLTHIPNSWVEKEINQKNQWYWR